MIAQNTGIPVFNHISFPYFQTMDADIQPTMGLPMFSKQWAAGFLDGEGCIHIARQTFRCGRSPNYRLRVSISQNNREVLEHFFHGFGIQGSIHAVKRLIQHNKQVYTLNYDGRHAMALISMLMPYLVRKRAEAFIAQEFHVRGQAGLRPGPKGLPIDILNIRIAYYKKLRRLK